MNELRKSGQQVAKCSYDKLHGHFKKATCFITKPIPKESDVQCQSKSNAKSFT